MFDGPVRTSEWVWAGRFAWVGQQGCQATRRAPQTVASISAASSSVDEAKYLCQTLTLLNWYPPGAQTCSKRAENVVLWPAEVFGRLKPRRE